MAHESKGFELLEQEILQAKAEALGRAGEKLRRAVGAYREAQATLDETPSARSELERRWQEVMRAREVLIVLREGIGLRQHDSVDAEYAIPLASRGSI
ncbi:MAG TPA: hypothetical protein VFQ35_26320 [Polyangiaceae bacterium]|nr:hypothetical protein [Polyangiaceae bacterium]